jgi:hypothetical protein
MKKITIEQAEDIILNSPKGRERLAGLQQTIQHLSTAKSTSLELPSRDGMLTIGLCGDMHFGNACEHLRAMEVYFDAITEAGVTHVFNTGDVLDGHNVYKGQVFELTKVGYDAQADWFEEKAPRRKGVNSYFITGNHDASFTKQAGVRVGEDLDRRRDDYHFIGADVGHFTLTGKDTDPIKLSMIHPDGGTAYALSYKPQKIVEQLEGGTKPDVLGIGHFHKSEMIPSYRNVTIFQTGTFERQTPFMARNGLSAHVGGWIVRIGKRKSVLRVQAEFIRFG